MNESSCEVDINNLPSDPALRKSINSYHPNIRDEVRRAYLQKRPCQPRVHNFKQTLQGTWRRFKPSWFDEFPTWLEYSVEKEAAYCLCCYLFKSDSKEHAGSGDAFVEEGFTNWKQKAKLQNHVGGPNSAHNGAAKNCEFLMNERQHLQSIIKKKSKQARSDYRIRLTAAVDCARFLLNQGSAFRGHDESDDSSNPGNFKSAMKLICKYNEELARLIRKCPKNHKLTSSDIQKDIVHACAIETINNVIQDLGNAFFSILVDEARDVSTQEQMAIVIRYVNKKGHVIEHLLDIVHVGDTSSLSLKAAIDATFSKYNLSMSRLRGQGYDGASNMQGQFSGLKALILLENENAFYVHCFAHQLQLALVAVAKSTDLSIGFLFGVVSHVVNVVGGSCKRHDMLLESQASKVLKAIESGELESGRGKNQTCTLKRAGETR